MEPSRSLTRTRVCKKIAIMSLLFENYGHIIAYAANFGKKLGTFQEVFLIENQDFIIYNDGGIKSDKFHHNHKRLPVHCPNLPIGHLE